MKVVFVSNYFNHHQKPFSDAMYQMLGDDYTFVSTSCMREERKKLGYTQDCAPVYVTLAYESPMQWQKALALINDADAVIAGSAPEDLLRERIREGKIVIRYSERPYKKKASLLKRLYHMVRLRQRDLWRKNIYMLCSSAYTAADFASLGMYKDHTYKWGYFPEVKVHDIDKLLERKKRNMILWCGRFIDWKHPDEVIRLAGRLKANGYDFQMNMIGTGNMEEQLRRMAEECDVTEEVCFLGSMPPEKVRIYMEEAGIYLFTSDRKEGWGAVLNEAMASGCAVVASDAAGATPYLVQKGQNGLVYRSGNLEELFEKVQFLLCQPDVQMQYGRMAHRTMTDTWNGKIAAERLMKFTEAILSGESHPDLYEDGPCSIA